MLELRHIVKDYVTGDTFVRALKGINVTFRKSEFVSILGPSGCGKTTLLNIVGGLDGYTSGDLIIDGRSTREFRAYDWDAYRNNCVGFVFQNYNLIPHLSVLGNVELALTLSGESKSARRARAAAALEKVGLSEQINKRPNQLSGGQMQRVAIARAIVNDPEIILADEPTGALDSKNSVQIVDLLKEISRDRLIIMVTHNDALAAQYSTRIIKLLDGEKVDDSDPYTPTQEERLEQIREKRESKKEIFRPEEYAPEVYPDPTTPVEKSRRRKKVARKGENAENSDASEIRPLPKEKLRLQKAARKGENAENSDASEIRPLAKEELRLQKAARKRENAEKKAQEKRRRQEMKRTSMGFATALSLSGRNLATKKGRTALVSFAGSIGIIGIALVLSISNGFTNYIDKLQTDTLAGFPITVTPRTIDVAGVTGSVGGAKKQYKEFPSDGRVEIYTRDPSTMIFFNNLGDEYLAYVREMENKGWTNAIDFANTVTMNVIAKNQPDGQEASYHIFSSSSSQGGISSSANWTELVPDNAFITDQYDVLEGKLPTEAGELALIIDKYNRISSSTLSALGLKYTLDEDGKLGFADILAQAAEFKVIINDNLFSDGNYSSLPDNTEESAALLRSLYEDDSAQGQKNLTLRLTGILRVKEGTPLAMYGTGIVHTKALTEAVIAANKDSGIIVKQKEQIAVPYGEGIDYTKKQAFYLSAGLAEENIRQWQQTEELLRSSLQSSGLPAQAVDALLQQIVDDPTLSFIPADKLTDQQRESLRPVAQMISIMHKMIRVAQNAALESLGAAEKPTSIFIYPKDFATKAKINDYLDAYNEAHPASKVMYTDASAILADTMGEMVDIVSYVLIAFAAVSLVVSSIMIAIITYVSVIERTKEIGVLRSIGARKKDISRVFNAETVLIGLIAGVLGVLIAFLLTFPINAIIGAVIEANGAGNLGIGNLASLHPLHALLLVIVSVLLTLVSGFIPSRIAAKKDPVTALRTE